MSTINKLKEKIKTLEKQLESSKSHTYINQSYHYWAEEGEFHVFYGDEKCVTWQIDDLYKSLEFMIEDCLREKQKQDSETLERIIESFEVIKEGKGGSNES